MTNQIRIKLIRIKNILSFKKETIINPENINIILGNNGVTKSLFLRSIIDSINYQMNNMYITDKEYTYNIEFELNDDIITLILCLLKINLVNVLCDEYKMDHNMLKTVILSKYMEEFFDKFDHQISNIIKNEVKIEHENSINRIYIKINNEYIDVNSTLSNYYDIIEKYYDMNLLNKIKNEAEKLNKIKIFEQIKKIDKQKLIETLNFNKFYNLSDGIFENLNIDDLNNCDIDKLINMKLLNVDNSFASFNFKPIINYEKNIMYVNWPNFLIPTFDKLYNNIGKYIDILTEKTFYPLFEIINIQRLVLGAIKQSIMLIDLDNKLDTYELSSKMLNPDDFDEINELGLFFDINYKLKQIFGPDMFNKKK